MPRYQALTKTSYAGKHFKRYTSYQFAASQNLAPLVQQELVKACMVLPIAFIQEGAQFVSVAVQGFLPGKNLLVAPDGRWIGGYIPAAYRSHPFALLPNEEGQLVLCIDTDSGLLNDIEGEALFDSDAHPAQAVKDVLGFLEQLAANGKATEAMCAALAEHQLIEPWPIKVQLAEGEEKIINGLHRINEAALNQLDAEALKALQQNGGLQMSYMQLLSMQHIDKLAELAKARAAFEEQQATKVPVTPNVDLDLEFLNQGGTLSFAGL